MREPKDLFALINDVRLHYRDWGNAGSDLLVLLHGSRGHCRTFDRIAPTLADDFHVVALSIRGHGDSDWAPPQSYNFEQIANDVFTFAQALGASRFAISGQSLGGVIGSFCAAKYPEAVSKLILGDIGPDTPEQYEAANNAPEFKRSAARSYDDYMAFTRRFVESDAAHRLLFENLAMLTEDGSWTSRGDPEFFNHLQRPTVEEYWGKVLSIICPTLLLRGENSTFLDRDVAIRMAHSMAQCTLIQIDGVGHSLLFEAEDAVLEHSVRFLGGGIQDEF